MTDLPRDDGPLQEAIFSYISRSSLTTSARVGKKQIHKQIQSSYNGRWTKKDVKRALKQLVTKEKIHKDSKEFFLPKPNANHDISKEEDDSDDASEANGDDSSDHGQSSSIVPIAQRLRRQQHSHKSIQSDDDHVNILTNKANSPKESSEQLQVDLDEEIRRLEAELAAGSASDDDDDDDDNAERTESDDDDDHPVTTNDIQSTGVICLSETANERIEPLPPAAMPQITRKTNADPAEANKRHKQQQHHTLHEGLRHAVHDVLANYKTRSEVQQTPWYCRVCQYQAEDQAEFLSHRDSVFHKTAVSEHKKKTFCKLCRKQMTSAVQFQEHLRSRPHRELLTSKKAQQEHRQQRNGRGGGNGMSSLGRGGGRAYGRGGGSQRQWC
ncbi:hypothetical protein ACHAW6_015804 [Cyclotella cf. meneghiniana]